MIDSWRRLHYVSIVASFHREGRGGKLWRSDWKRSQSAVFQTRMGSGGGGDRLRSTLIATWSEREGVSCILQWESEGEREEAERVMSIIVEYLQLENVG